MEFTPFEGLPQQPNLRLAVADSFRKRVSGRIVDWHGIVDVADPSEPLRVTWRRRIC
jgi:hypothetical protein